MRLTIFTPTYNRIELLGRVYESLKRQTVKDFEWLIVDDGSTDETADIVRRWVLESVISIRYFYRENGGKMRAHNTGVEIAKAPLFMCVDSDDYLIDTAVEDMLRAYDEAVEANEGGTTVGGVVAHKGKSQTELLGGSDFPVTGVSTLYNLYLKGFAGETTLMYDTKILSLYPFPEIEGEKYVPEDYIYDKIDNVCVLAILPKIITVCEIVKEGYTDSVKKLKVNNPVAWYLYYEQRAYITPFSKLKIKYLGRYVIYAIRSKNGLEKSKRIGFINKIIGLAYAFVLIIIRKE